MKKLINSSNPNQRRFPYSLQKWIANLKVQRGVSSILLAVCAVLIAGSLLLLNGGFSHVNAAPQSPNRVTFYGAPTSSIASAVAVPHNQAFFYTSGTVPPVVDSTKPPGTIARFGDTYTQAKGTLTRIENLLKDAGLSMSDVVYITCYLVPDPSNNNRIDFAGWTRAYGEFFNNPTNPVKVARSTVGVHSLVDAGWLVEIEAIATYPKGDR